MHTGKKEIHFGDRADQYDHGFEGKFLKKFYQTFLQSFSYQAEAKVLDVACGTGELLKQMRGRFQIQGFGIDADERMVGVAKRKCPGMDIRTAKCDRLPFDDKSFDSLTVCMAFHHFDNRKGFIKEASRVLKSGGTIYVIELRAPFLIRKAANRIMQHCGIAGHFFTASEISQEFCEQGIEEIGCIQNGRVQIVCLRNA